MKVADAHDLDPPETMEWLDALSAVRSHRGNERAEFVVSAVIDAARRGGLQIEQSLTTPYCNTIPPDQQPVLPGDRAIEHKLRSIIRWNALAIVLRANKESSELGGHIASFQSAATLYDIGFGHFWHAPTDAHGGDLIFVQVTIRDRRDFDMQTELESCLPIALSLGDQGIKQARQRGLVIVH